MSIILFVLVFCLGMLSMGLQLVASRVLAPFFGSTIFVWATLITTFLAAFSAGSFTGALVSARSPAAQRKIAAIIMGLGTGFLLLDSFFSYAICDWLDLRIE